MIHGIPPVAGEMKPIPQPPMNRFLRDRERHDFWPAFVLALAGVVLAACGAYHVTGLATTGGGKASEAQLVMGFASGGLQYADRLAPPPPPNFDADANPAEALDRWTRQQASAKLPAWKVRVDITSRAACPT